jgi:DNA-binding PadR family transcriptional regulator
MSVPVKEVRREYKITDAGKKYLEEQQKDPDLAQQTEAEAAADDKKINIYDTEQPEETAKEVKRKRFKLF